MTMGQLYSYEKFRCESHFFVTWSLHNTQRSGIAYKQIICIVSSLYSFISNLNFWKQKRGEESVQGVDLTNIQFVQSIRSLYPLKL